MNDTVDFWVLRKHLVEGGFVGHVDLVEQGPLPTDQLNAIYRHLGRVVKVVDNDDIVVIFEQRKGGERPNVAGATVSHPYQRQMCFFFFSGEFGGDAFRGWHAHAGEWTAIAERGLRAAEVRNGLTQ